MRTPTQYRAFTAEDAVRAAEVALARQHGGAFTIGEVRDLAEEARRNIILRASAIDAHGRARAIIIKATRSADYDPAAENAYAKSGLVKEWAAGMLLKHRGARTATLLAGDISQGVLVFEDHGEALASLVRPLLHGSAAEAELALTAYAGALGELHMATLDCRTDHSAILHRELPSARVPPPGHRLMELVPATITQQLGGHLPGDELALVAARIASPGPWLALVHRDPCPDNVLLAGDGTARLIDFEFAGPGHALLDAAYWRMGFPTCWCAGTVPEVVAARIDHAYRTAVAPSIPAVADDASFQRESAIISMIWLFGSLEWLLEWALKEESHWGIATRRSRILHYADVAIRTTAEAGVLQGIRGVAQGWRAELQRQWPNTKPLAPYPAFTGLNAP
jgi:hypothetical protein